MDLYCKLYISSALAKDQLNDLLVDLVGGRLDGFAISSQGVLFHIFTNNLFDPGADAEEFVLWPYYAEIEAEDEEDEDPGRFVQLVRRVIDGLRARGMGAVASSDLEDLLEPPV